MLGRNKPRKATEDDIAGWFEAAEMQRGPKTRAAIIAALERKNKYRMWRLRYDYRWLQKQLKRMGLNPEDAKELL